MKNTHQYGLYATCKIVTERMCDICDICDISCVRKLFKFVQIHVCHTCGISVT